MANLATDKIIGRVTNSTGVPEAVTFTDQAQALCDDTSFATMRNTLGLDTFDLAVAIDNPTARTYTIARKFSQAWTLVNITAGTDQGTLTLNVRKAAPASPRSRPCRSAPPTATRRPPPTTPSLRPTISTLCLPA